jgi:hypothetical protein
MLKGRAKPPQVLNGWFFYFVGQLEGLFYQDKSMVGWKNDIDEGSPYMVAQK